jgi:hypothetical protein
MCPVSPKENQPGGRVVKLLLSDVERLEFSLQRARYLRSSAARGWGLRRTSLRGPSAVHKRL